jgi:hypothetical protein
VLCVVIVVLYDGPPEWVADSGSGVELTVPDVLVVWPLSEEILLQCCEEGNPHRICLRTCVFLQYELETENTGYRGMWADKR